MIDSESKRKTRQPHSRGHASVGGVHPAPWLAFCSTAWEPEWRSRDWSGSRIQDWHICPGGSLSGRPGSDGRLCCRGWLQAQAGRGVGEARSPLTVGTSLPFLAQVFHVFSVIISNANKRRKKADQGSKPGTIPTYQVILNKSSNVSVSVFSCTVRGN